MKANLKKLIRAIKSLQSEHGTVRSIHCRSYKGNMNVTYSDGYWESWTTDHIVKSGADQVEMKVQIQANFASKARVSIYTLRQE